MSEHPILFCGELVRANHAGLKWVTRRLSGLKKVNVEPNAWEVVRYYRDKRGRWGVLFRDTRKAVDDVLWILSRFGGPGSTLWTRETWAAVKTYDDWAPCQIPGSIIWYRATEHTSPGRGKWRPSIHMPRWVSRDSYKVVSVRCERLHDITVDDIIREGVASEGELCREGLGQRYPDWDVDMGVERFRTLWDKINGSRGYPWDMNPWVWRVEYLNPAAVEKGNQEGCD